MWPILPTKACQVSVPNAAHDASAISAATMPAVMNDAPMSARRQHDGKQQSEVRLVGQQSEQDAGEDRPLDEHEQRAAHERGAEEAVLPDDDVGEHGGKCRGEKISGTLADDTAQAEHVGQESREQEDDLCRNVGDLGEQGGDRQVGRRIMPAEIAVERMAERDHFHRLVRRPVVDRGRIALQNQLPGGPDVDEIVRHRAGRRRSATSPARRRRRDRPACADDQRKADQFDRLASARAARR